MVTTSCVGIINSVEDDWLRGRGGFLLHANRWTITWLDQVLLAETRAMLRTSAIGVGRTWPHLVYHKLTWRGSRGQGNKGTLIREDYPSRRPEIMHWKNVAEYTMCSSQQKPSSQRTQGGAVAFEMEAKSMCGYRKKKRNHRQNKTKRAACLFDELLTPNSMVSSLLVSWIFCKRLPSFW